MADDAVLAEEIAEVKSTAGPELEDVIRTVLQPDQESGNAASLTIDYPRDETIFPPEIVAPTFLWHEPTERVDTWLIEVAFEEASARILVLAPGRPPSAGEIDPECITKNNEVYRPTPYQGVGQELDAQ